MLLLILKYLILGILIFVLALGFTKMVGKFAQKLEKEKNDK